jgi:serine/threonine protein kinase
MGKEHSIYFLVPLFQWGKCMHLVRNNFVGKEIRGYRIIKQLATNTLGHVYLAQSSVTTDSFVAVKIFTSINITSQQDSETFLQEAQFLTTLKQPRLLPVVECGVERGHPYLVMPYVAGGSLRRRMKQMAPSLLPLTESIELISRIGFVLATLHRRNILHCDLRPENVLFIAEKDVALCDPGLASILEHISDRQTLRELSTYFAPEQIVGNVTAKSDQYALGCIAYELLTGKLPPTPSSLGTNSSGTIMRAFVAPSRINSALPTEVDSVLFKAMAVRPENRYDNVMLFIQALRAALPAVKRRQAIVTQRLDATDVAALAASKTLLEAEQKRDSEPDAPTMPEQRVVEERKSTKLVRAFPIIAINKNRRRFPPPPWLLLLLFALLLVGALTMSPLLRSHSPSVTSRPTPTVVATKIASIPGVVPTATSTPKPRITPTITSMPSLAPRKTPVPSPTAAPTSPPIAPTQAPPGGPALLQGTVGTPPATVNLTDEGTRDWIEWGTGDANSVNRKAGVVPQISSYTLLGDAPYNNYGNADVQFSWFDGTPNAVMQGVSNGVATYNNGGFQITVPAQRAVHVLRIYASVNSARCAFSAMLSGGGSYSDASLVGYGDTVADGIYTIYFRASSDNQTLTVTLLQINNTNAGGISIEAATLE